MSHTTQCPSCQTRFRVTDAQLNVAGGLVRCGRCSHVFNAREALVEPSPPPPPPPPSPAVEAEDDFELELPEFDPLGPSEPPAAETPPKPTPLASFEPEHNLPEPMAEPVPARAQADELDAFQRALTEAMQPQPTTPITPFEIEQDEPVVRRATRSEMYDSSTLREDVEPALTATPIRATEPAHEAEQEQEQQQKAPRTRIEIDWRKWAQRVLNGLYATLGLLGIAVLIGQLAYYNRTRIAAEVPELRPALENACAKLGCTVPWPTDADLIRTEWSEMSFVPDHNNLIQLSATLKNHATYPQAFPIMELTLKDGEDQVLVRRSFTPAEYLKPDDKKLGRFNANSEVKVVVRLDVGKLKTMGYSLFWYYP